VTEDIIIFQRPEAAWWFVVGLVTLLAGRALKRRPYAGTATASWLQPPVYRASRLRGLPLLLVVAALAAIVGALMDPVIPYSEERVESMGIDIAIVLDLSSSMEEPMGTASSGTAASGTPRTRLAVTKAAIADYIRRRPGDRIGLIVFSDQAYVVSPLTADHAYLRGYVEMIDEQILRHEGMTAIGEGLALANTLLKRQAAADRRREQLIVLFTDGENNHGRDPFDALEDARAARHRVHMIGVDLAQDVRSKPDVVRLVRTVQRAGGRYFTADTAAQLAQASRALDALEPGIVVSNRSVRNAPVFDWFAAGAILLVCMAAMLRTIPYFIDLT
jgi:Ca-activated chloride channel family protein